MAYTKLQWKQMQKIKDKYPDLSIRQLKEKIHDKLGFSPSVKSLHNNLFGGKKKKKRNKKQEIYTIDEKSLPKKDELVKHTKKDGKAIYNKPELIDAIWELRQAGKSTSEIANTLGIPIETVNTYIYKTPVFDGKTMKQVEDTTLQEIVDVNLKHYADMIKNDLIGAERRKQVYERLVMSLLTRYTEFMELSDPSDPKARQELAYFLSNVAPNLETAIQSPIREVLTSAKLIGVDDVITNASLEEDGQYVKEFEIIMEKAKELDAGNNQPE